MSGPAIIIASLVHRPFRPQCRPLLSSPRLKSREASPQFQASLVLQDHARSTVAQNELLPTAVLTGIAIFDAEIK